MIYVIAVELFFGLFLLYWLVRAAVRVAGALEEK